MELETIFEEARVYPDGLLHGVAYWNRILRIFCMDICLGDNRLERILLSLDETPSWRHARAVRTAIEIYDAACRKQLEKGSTATTLWIKDEER